MTIDQRIQVNSVVQIDPEHDPRFGACYLVVTEMKSFGVQGYVKIPGTWPEGGNAYYRVGFEHIVYIGEAEWVQAEPEEQADEPKSDT